VTQPLDAFNAWLTLNQSGRLLDREALAALPEPAPVPRALADRLRDVIALAPEEPQGEAFSAVLDLVLEEACGLSPPDGAGAWRKANQVGAADVVALVDGTQHKPRRLLDLDGRPVLAVFVTGATRVGLHNGRRDTAQAIEYLRRRRLSLGIVTNGREWRLLFADPDNLAWVEWASDRLLEGDVLSPAGLLLRRVLSLAALTPARQPSGDISPSPLLEAIRRTRRGQARLSKELGERVRGAVELLLTARRPVLEPHWNPAGSKAVYDAACHFVMRLVVVLFAEARELLPVDNPVYHHGYGLKGLIEALERAGKAQREIRHQAWPRLLALFRLLHDGSPHPALVVPTYGGDLFRPGEGARNAQERALARIEDVVEPPSDEVVYRLLTLLTRTTERVLEGSSFHTVAAPVDFTELTSEYIGILYEGLLDYELHRAGDGPVVFLGIGDQPALPLDRLEGMSDKQLQALVEKAKVKKGEAGEDGQDEEGEGERTEESEGEQGETEGADAAPEGAGEPDILDGEVALDDVRADALRRALAWAERAAAVAKLVRAPRGKRGANDPAYRAEVEKAARQLIARKPDGSPQIVLPGELYVVRWGGTRKGAGTFYTRPQLTLPTVRRTLEPLLVRPDGSHRTPEEILALKVCDPAMGSGSFLVASLRVLTEAVVAALHQHGRLLAREGRGLVRIECDLLPDADRDQSLDGVEAIVRRAVVEHCLYGVDKDPLAVELARVSLWVETLDRRLPFTFLDHKLRCGDALVGTWLDRFRDYPLLAWWRQSPDEKWRGVIHQGDVWAAELKALRLSVVEEQRKLLAGETRLPFAGASDDELKKAIERVRDLYRQIHRVPASQPDKRAKLWRSSVADDPAMARVKEAFDTWCALWFWPLDKLTLAPRPMDLLAPSEETRAVVREVATNKRFFHWELEFPDVFSEKGSGFSAVVSNPPWETSKPKSQEFFANLDPLFRGYSKQDALTCQRELFASDPSVERAWLAYVGVFKDAGNFVRNASAPFGDATDDSGRCRVPLVTRNAAVSARLHQLWKGQRSRRVGYTDPNHPFCHQGSADLNTYKLFTEAAYRLVTPGGALGLVIPAALLSDQGSRGLRELLVFRSSIDLIYVFQNERKVFKDVHHAAKQLILIAHRHACQEAPTSNVLPLLFRLGIGDSPEADEVPGDLGGGRVPVRVLLTELAELSPKSLSVLEIRSQRDLEVLTKIYENSVLLGDDGPDGWGIKYATEFHMTNDSKLFIPREKAEEAGYKADEYGRWIGPEGDVLLPLYEGRMIGQFDFSKKGWVSGKGRSAVWRDIPWEKKVVEPQFLMRRSDFVNQRSATSTRSRVAFMDVTAATNARTMIAAPLAAAPCGNSAPVLFSDQSPLATSAVLNSYAYDFVARARCGGLHLNYFVIEETPLIARSVASELAPYGMALSWAKPLAVLQLEGRPHARARGAVTTHERLRLRSILDALVAVLYGLSRDDLRWILRDCDHPRERLADKAFCRTLDPKGFWRVDKTEDPELRHSVLTLVAFDALDQLIAAHGGDRDQGIAAFSALNDGEGWMLPETLRLADHGLGHDDRAQHPQPVASRLGPRFLDWQLAQTPEESWAECERHARAILGDEEFDRRFAKPKAENLESHIVAKDTVSETLSVSATTRQLSLFEPPTTAGTTEPRPMTISNIRLLNFRNWAAEHWQTGVVLKPVTLLLGRNSAGKTSILQPLRLLKQTIEATDARTHLLLDGTKYDGVNLGAFTDVAHDHDAKAELGVGFDLQEKQLSADVRFRLVDERPVIEALSYRVRDERVEVSRTPNAYQLASARFRLPNWDGARDVHEPRKAYEPGRAIEVPDQALTDLGPTLGPQVRAAIVAVKDAFASFHYLGPLRPPPAREVTWSQQDPTRLGSTGSETIQALIGNETGRQKGTLRAAVSKWLRRLDLADEIDIARVGKTLFYQLEVVRGGERSNLVDVGFGVSQVLPVIVHLHFVPEGSVILCEDPEAHLHPLAQAALADMFMEVAQQRKLQVLLETHSEYLFRRLQYLIAAGSVRSDECALYYVERDEPSARLTTLAANEYGQIANWPDHFFGDAMGETERQVRKIIERKRASKEGSRG
jgi:hypothetical protein